MRRTLPVLLFALSLQADDLSHLMTLKTYSQERISSFDRDGANDDGGRKNPLKPGETRTIGEVQGPGVITHMWFTIAAPEPYHLKQLVIRMYWDGDTLPVVEAPIGDFFGLGLGEYFVYESGPLQLGSRSTYPRARIGGIEGRALAGGDRLQCDPQTGNPWVETCRTLPWPVEPGPIRVLGGPQDDHFTLEALAAFLGNPYRVTRDMDRMGIRLDGEKLTHNDQGAEIVSDGVAPGSIQVRPMASPSF